MLSESKFLLKKKLTIGGNVTENEPMIKGDWRTATNRTIAKTLIENLVNLLQGKVSYMECSDRTTHHKKIVIEYDHKKKNV